MSEPRKLPKFNSVKEEAEFWDTHDITDYLVSEEPLNLVYSPITEKKETMTLRMAPSLKHEIENVAKEYDIGTSSLIRMWVVDKLRERKIG
jgi:predicted DNA binding CopG/RHH family protein